MHIPNPLYYNSVIICVVVFYVGCNDLKLCPANI